jgi:hypothetical protein
MSDCAVASGRNDTGSAADCKVGSLPGARRIRSVPASVVDCEERSGDRDSPIPIWLEKACLEILLSRSEGWNHVVNYVSAPRFQNLSAASARNMQFINKDSFDKVDAMYKNLILELEAPLAVVTLNRPQCRNALSLALLQELLNQATKDWHSECDSVIAAMATFPNSELFPLCRPLLLSPSPLASKR